MSCLHPAKLSCLEQASKSSTASDEKAFHVVLQIMKLVDKIDFAINKVRSLTHFIGKKPHDGPCTLKVKVRTIPSHHSALLFESEIVVPAWQILSTA